MALESNALTTMDNTKMYLDITDTTTDNLLEFLINSTSTRIESECNRRFGKTVYSETYSGNGRAHLKLRNYPVLAISEVKIDGEVVTDYVLQSDSGILWRRNDRENFYFDPYVCDLVETMTLVDEIGWPKDKIIQITYTAGYVLPAEDTLDTPKTLPSDLELCCIQLVSMVMNARGTEGLLVEVIGPLRNHLIPDIPDYIQRILNRYKNPVLS